MAGHSKWANIKHRKSLQDKKKSKIFSKLVKEISIAIKQGGNDQNTNTRLRTAILNAKSASLPKDNIIRALNKGSQDGANYKDINIEAYAPNGIAIFVECTTENTNRTISNIRAIFNKSGGSIAKNGSLDFLFDRMGVFIINRSSININLSELEMDLIDFGLEEIDYQDDTIIIYCVFEYFGKMQNHLNKLNINIENNDIQMIPKSTISLNIEDSKKILKIFDKLDDDDDVKNFFHNLKIDDKLEQFMV